MDTSSVPPPKKGLGVFGWLGIGCGGLILCAVLIGGVGFVWLKPAIKQFVADQKTNPTRAAANLAVSVSLGQLEMVAADDVKKRYTLRQKTNGDLTTFYWDAKRKVPDHVKGDFSAIPADADSPDTPAPPSETK
jgi:hypothetical protein